MLQRAFFPFSMGMLLSAWIPLVAHSGANGVPAGAAMSDERKTYCFGRHLVDLPIDAELKLQESFYGASGIYAKRGKRGDFLARQKSVRAEKTYVPEEILDEKSRKSVEQLLHKMQSDKEDLRLEDWRFLMEFEEAEKRDAARKEEYAYLRSEYPENSDKQILVSKATRYQEADYALDAFVHPGGEYFFSFSGKGLSRRGDRRSRCLLPGYPVLHPPSPDGGDSRHAGFLHRPWLHCKRWERSGQGGYDAGVPDEKPSRHRSGN
ncbi:MAG: hypothetical protein LBU11_07570 [Zoogloeaceae bacterium]|jgi:hypothetical protein|nr:hypothetical protein [Zoogloeaceae bacterium]